MAQIKRRKAFLINTPTDFPAQFLDASNAVVSAATATKFQLLGFSPVTELTTIHGVIGSRGLEGTRNVLRLNNTNVTVTGPIPANTIVNVFIEAITTDYEAEYNRYMGHDGAIATYQVLLQTGDTYDVFLAKLYNTIRQDLYMNYKQLVRVEDEATITGGGNGTFVNGLATSITQLDIIATDITLKLNIDVTGIDRLLTSAFVQVGAPIVVTPQFNGTNNYQVLKGEFPQWNRLPYSYDYTMTPYRGNLYTSFRWSTLVSHEQLGGGFVTDQVVESTPVYDIYINETCDTLINDLVDFFDRATTLSTANPVKYKAPVWYGPTNPPTAVAAAAFKI